MCYLLSPSLWILIQRWRGGRQIFTWFMVDMAHEKVCPSYIIHHLGLWIITKLQFSPPIWFLFPLPFPVLMSWWTGCRNPHFVHTLSNGSHLVSHYFVFLTYLPWIAIFRHEAHTDSGCIPHWDSHFIVVHTYVFACLLNYGSFGGHEYYVTKRPFWLQELS